MSTRNTRCMVQNSAGGRAFALDPFARLERFLILGADGPTYYAAQRTLALENAACVTTCLALDGARTVKTIADVSNAGRAPKNDAALFALAMACGAPADAMRRAALNALPRVCRTGTHLFQFAETVGRFRRWGRGLRRAVAAWYLDLGTDALVRQVLKYGQRQGWSHRDVLRLSHAAPRTPAQQAVFRWLTAKEITATDAGLEALSEACRAFEALRARSVTEAEVIASVRRHKFTHEMLPTEWKRSPAVWAALLEDMPLTAMLRGLAQMTSVGLLTPGSEAAAFVGRKLTDAAALGRARIHPLAVLSALRVYRSGRGLAGKLTWTSERGLCDALERCFDLSFRAITPSGKRHLLALDVSGSMSCGEVGGSPGLTPAMASAAMAMATLRVERHCELMGFSHQLVDLPIRREHTLTQVMKIVQDVPMGATDCALPMLEAARTGRAVDVFVVYTDNETWFGKVHPHLALRQYREKTGIAAKLAVVGLTATQFTIADPDDPGSLDFVGFDAAAPAVMADFARAR